MVDAARVREAHRFLRTQLPPTPLVFSEHFSEKTGAQVHLKLENLQRTGSFKIRGALNKLRRLGESVGNLGVVAASAGNHAQGVALAASRLGIPATIVMPENAPIGKQLATRDYGGRVILSGQTVNEALLHARDLAKQGYTFVHPFDDPDVIAGQGSVGREILEQLEAFDEVWIPIGGGGLAAGIALAVKDLDPGIRIVGVQTEACPSAAEARRQGGPAAVTPRQSIADGILVPRMGDLPFAVLASRLDDLFTVEESAIAMTIVQLLEKKKLLTEGAGAAALAALLAAPPERIRGRTIVVVLSGGNVDLNVLDRILEQGLIRTGRILRFEVVLDDRPGALAGLLAVLSDQKANILHILHDRLSVDLPIGRSRVDVEVETRGFDHNRQILETLTAAGFRSRAHQGAAGPAGSSTAAPRPGNSSPNREKGAG